MPHDEDFTALVPHLPAFCAYVLRLIYVGIYWNNHHHLCYAIQRVNGSVLWANLPLLFWLSLFSITTDWMGESHLRPVPTACYGFVLFMTALAWYITRTLTAIHGDNAQLEQALGADRKGKISVVLDLTAIAVSFWQSWLAALIYALVAAMWLIPDRRIERMSLNEE